MIKRISLTFLALLPAMSIAAECTEIKGSPEQVAHLTRMANSDEVRTIRAGISEYLSGCGSACKIAQPEALTGLGKIDKSYIESKFTIFQGRPTWAGGIIFEVIFKDRQDKTFRAWVSRLEPSSGGFNGWYLMDFKEGNVDPVMVDRITCMGKYYINHPDLAI